MHRVAPLFVFFGAGGCFGGGRAVRLLAVVDSEGAGCFVLIVREGSEAPVWFLDRTELLCTRARSFERCYYARVEGVRGVRLGEHEGRVPGRPTGGAVEMAPIVSAGVKPG